MANVTDWLEPIKRISERYAVPPALTAAVMQQESGGDPNAVSPVGAVGLMQVVGGSKDPTTNIEQGVAFLRAMLNRYGQNVTLALAAYNAGPRNVDKYGGVPPFAETQSYVNLVRGFFNTWRERLVAPKVMPPSGIPATGAAPAEKAIFPSPISLPQASTLIDAVSNVGAAIVAAPTQIAAPFVDFFGRLKRTLDWLNDPKLARRVLFLILGIILVVIGLVLFALSFVPRPPSLPTLVS